MSKAVTFGSDGSFFVGIEHFPAEPENEWEMQCPTCGRRDWIDVSAHVWVRLTEDGTETSDDETEWGSEDAARCISCNFRGTVGDFQRAYEDREP